MRTRGAAHGVRTLRAVHIEDTRLSGTLWGEPADAKRASAPRGAAAATHQHQGMTQPQLTAGRQRCRRPWFFRSQAGHRPPASSRPSTRRAHMGRAAEYPVKPLMPVTGGRAGSELPPGGLAQPRGPIMELGAIALLQVNPPARPRLSRLASGNTKTFKGMTDQIRTRAVPSSWNLRGDHGTLDGGCSCSSRRRLGRA
jgi:hypothetical protein